MILLKLLFRDPICFHLVTLTIPRVPLIFVSSWIEGTDPGGRYRMINGPILEMTPIVSTPIKHTLANSKGA